MLKEESLIAGYTEAWLASAEPGIEGTGVTAVTCVAKETDSAFLFCKIKQKQYIYFFICMQSKKKKNL